MQPFTTGAPYQPTPTNNPNQTQANTMATEDKIYVGNLRFMKGEPTDMDIEAEARINGVDTEVAERQVRELIVRRPRNRDGTPKVTWMGEFTIAGGTFYVFFSGFPSTAATGSM